MVVKACSTASSCRMVRCEKCAEARSEIAAGRGLRMLGFDRKDRGAEGTPSAYLDRNAINRDRTMSRIAPNPASAPSPAKLASLDETRWQAFMERDPAFDGRFFVAVKTTGIYCRPS